MKCLRCGHDSKYKERSGGRCPNCHKDFAFEPREGGKFTDVAFQSAIDAVSANGKVRWGVEHLYYELCRKRRFKLKAEGCLIPGLILLSIGIVGFMFDYTPLKLGLFVGAAGVIASLWIRLTRTVMLSKEEFEKLWVRWQKVHGPPSSLIVRKSRQKAERPAEPDLEDYSFDRAVICDRARTVDLLLANNFHFENNCAVLAVSGYPAGPFELVRKMLRRNPRLQVFALHDADPDGCRLAHRLAGDPEWFKGHAKVIDVGLRPAQAGPFRGLLLSAQAPVAAGSGISPAEAKWLSSYALELAAIRPEQVLKRLFRAMNRKPETDGGSDGDSSSFDVVLDVESFGSDAEASDGGADGFG